MPTNTQPSARDRLLAETRRKYPTFERLAASYSPALQPLLLAEPEKAYSEKSPLIGDLDRMYRPGASALWVKTQLLTLDFASRTKEGADMASLQEFSTLFAARYGHVKLTEFIAFTARFKLGRYGKFYGYFDTLTVGEAFRKFLRERSEELSLLERKKENQRREEQAQHPVKRDYVFSDFIREKLHIK